MGSLGDINMVDVLANLFFIASGVALGVRAADDLMLWRDRRAERLAQRKA